MFDVTERVRTGLYLFNSDNLNSLASPPLHFQCLLATSVAHIYSEADKKLIELVRKCEELYDMSNKKHSDTVWEEKLISLTLNSFVLPRHKSRRTIKYG